MDIVQSDAFAHEGKTIDTVVPEHYRLGFLPRHFGRYMMQVEAAVYGHMGTLCSRYSGGYARLPVIETHGEREQVVPVDHGQRDVLMLKRAAVLSSASFYNDRVVASFRRGCFRPDELQDRRQTLSLGHAQPLVHILRPGCVPSPVLFSSSRARSMSAMCRVAGCRVAVPYGSTRPQPAVRQRPLSRPPLILQPFIRLRAPPALISSPMPCALGGMWRSGSSRSIRPLVP